MMKLQLVYTRDFEVAISAGKKSPVLINMGLRSKSEIRLFKADTLLRPRASAPKISVSKFTTAVNFPLSTTC